MSEIARDVHVKQVKPKKQSSLWWMYIPALLSVLVFMIYPFVKGTLITFTNWNGFSQVYQWVDSRNMKGCFLILTLGIS